jgi:glutamine amidotransferase
MITIVDYENTDATELSEFIKDIYSEIVISANEPDIMRGDKLILPHCKDISSSIKKLHLLNLFSILRIIKKPILGIGTGMHLMTKSLKDKNAACLGCFPVDCESKDQLEDGFSEMKPINIIKESKLLEGIGREDKFSFESNCFISSNEYTTSTAQIDGEITSSLEKEHLFGVQFNPEHSSEPGLKILKNFLQM